MKTAEELISQLNPEAMKQAHDICAFMSDSEIGMAVYSEDFVLLASNPAYREVRDLPDGGAMPGLTLIEIITSMYRKEKALRDDLVARVQQDMARLKHVGFDKINGKNGSGESIRISRFTRPNGLIVETIEHMEMDKEAYQGVHGEGARNHSIGYARLMSALDDMPDGFVIYNKHGILVAMNQSARDMVPEVAEHFYIGARHEDIMRAVYRSGSVDKTGSSDKKNWNDKEIVSQTEEEFLAWEEKERLNPSHESIYQLADGRWLQFSGRKLSGGGTIFVRSDVTNVVQQQAEARKAIEARVLESERAQIAYENLYAGLAVFDEDERLVQCNSNYRNMLHLSEDFMEPGRPRADIISKAIELGAFADNYSVAALKTYQGSVGSAEEKNLKYYMSDGRIFNSRYCPIPGKGAIVLVLDVTNEERALEQVARSNQMLERSNGELQNFAYVASHDLQEPLRKIEAFGDRLSKKYNDLLPEDGQMYMDRIQNASGRMRQLINDLLSFSRVTSNAKAFQSVNLNEVLTGVESDIQMRLEESHGVIKSSELPVIDADPVQMRQLFQNLLSNSLKFVREGVSPVVEVTSRIITQDKGQGDLLELRFADNGIGFDNSYKDQIFAIFQRLHGRMEFEGTGIGLSTCRKIVDRHCGTIDADGVEGQGATFIVQLPIKQNTNDATA